jgi:hypothetical protein
VTPGPDFFHYLKFAFLFSGSEKSDTLFSNEKKRSQK